MNRCIFQLAVALSLLAGVQCQVLDCDEGDQECLAMQEEDASLGVDLLALRGKINRQLALDNDGARKASERQRLRPSKQLLSAKQAMPKKNAATCQGDSNSFDAGWGPCATYTPGQGNHYYCSMDCVGGLCAVDVCPQCGSCSEEAPVPAASVPQQDDDYQCDTSYNFVSVPYSQISLTDGCNNGVCNANPKYGGPNSVDAAIAYCKNDCNNRDGCEGFFFQIHGNGHEICGFYDQPLSDDQKVAHGHAAGSQICEKSSAAAVAWYIGSSIHPAETCDQVCAANGATCSQTELDSLNGMSDSDIIAKYAAAGHTCNSLARHCDSGSNCVNWGSPYIHNSHFDQGLCWAGDVPTVAPCGQTPVDGNHRRLCPCEVDAGIASAPEAPTGPTCQGDSSSFNAGWGPCSTYNPGQGNHYYCPYDCVNGLCAKDVCPECGDCS